MWAMASNWTNNNSRRRHGFFRGGDSLPFLVHERRLVEMLRKFREKRVWLRNSCPRRLLVWGRARFSGRKRRGSLPVLTKPLRSEALLRCRVPSPSSPSKNDDLNTIDQNRVLIQCYVRAIVASPLVPYGWMRTFGLGQSKNRH
jgi:hypothetical protein